MNEATRRAYLEALGIPVWIGKACADEAAGLVVAGVDLGPGDGQVLLVCGGQDEPATRLAADIARALGAEPVWAWAGAPGTGLAEAVSEKLFTTVLILGRALADGLLGRDTPRTVGSARILVAPGLDELAREPRARKALWRMIRDGRPGGISGAA